MQVTFAQCGAGGRSHCLVPDLLNSEDALFFLLAEGSGCAGRPLDSAEDAGC